jgi:hypothetical protein
MNALIREVREAAANEAEKLLGHAVARLKQSPAELGAVEKAVREGLHKIGGSILAGAMRVWGNGYVGSRKLCSCGAKQKYVSDRERGVVSLLGAFRLRRAYYWCGACGESDAPMDRALGIEGTRFSPSVREGVALLGAEVPFGRGQMLLRELTGIRVSKRKHEEISEAIGASLKPKDGAERDRPALPHNGAISQPVEDLYVSTDGTMAPTREGWREVKVGAIFQARRGRDSKAERLKTHYLGDIIEAETFGWRLYREAEEMGLEHARRVIVIGDGAPWIWNMAALHFPHAIQIVDWYHATERLWTVANAYFGEGTSEARQWVARSEKLLKASRVEAIIKRLRHLRKPKPKVCEIIDEAIGYFQNNAQRMRYRRYRRQGLFIGSGVVEAACKHIVGQRFKQSGMRWNLQGLCSILYLRLAVLNARWPSNIARAA